MKPVTQPLCITVLLLLSFQAVLAESFEKGIKAYENSKFATAVSEFENAAAEEETAAVRHNLALATFQNGQVSEAVWQLERAVQLDPMNREYRFKLEALRQELGLFAQSPAWYELAASALPANHWILVANLGTWGCVIALLIPWMRSRKIGIFGKLILFASVASILITGPLLWLNLNRLDRAILISDESVELYAAPATAAPVAGTGRAGERAEILQIHNNFYEIKTEGNVTGWVSGDLIRPLIIERTGS
ncbi:MAG: SH3 domain-containing protein [Verrucomicrobiota bacterium]